jgi:legumain
MKLLLLVVCLLSIAACDNWAVLVAGSNTWSNYRHQSDVFHAYQILKKNGFAPERIITFAYDDIASNIKNPFKGKVFNKPTNANPGIDVYDGVVIDYKGASVDPTVFLNVLEGNKSAVAGKGSGKVLESTKDDNVFIFFSDHGAPGLIAFPSKYLYAKDLIPTFAKMNGKYNKLVFYLEACESGSMFTSLPNNTKIYALSAANPSESSWATYCAPQDIVQGKHIGSCLGDLFSVNFLENTETSDIFSMTLNQQFQIIKQKTNESHVLQWGDMSYATDKVSEFLAYKKSSNFKFGIPRLNQLRRNGRI